VQTIKKTLIINGSPRVDGDCATLIRELKKNLQGDIVEVSAFRSNIAPCVDCRGCHETARCVINDEMQVMARAPSIRSLGTVAEPVANVTVSGDTLRIAISCATQGASIFWSEDGAPQIPYTGPITMDIKGRDLAANPVTFYMTAVREGWDDAGIITSKYPGLSPAFKTQYNSMTNQPVVFEAADGVSNADWKAWSDAITFVTMKAPSQVYSHCIYRFRSPLFFPNIASISPGKLSA